MSIELTGKIANCEAEITRLEREIAQRERDLNIQVQRKAQLEKALQLYRDNRDRFETMSSAELVGLSWAAQQIVRERKANTSQLGQVRRETTPVIETIVPQAAHRTALPTITPLALQPKGSK